MYGPDSKPHTTPRSTPDLIDPAQDHYDMVVEMMREISRQTDPQTMVSVFRKRAPRLYGGDESVSLSRRELEEPFFRITRSSRWKEAINPWREPERLPLLEGGLLAELLYGDEPRTLRDVCVPPTDPAHEYLANARSLIALPLYDSGVAINMVVRTSPDARAFDDIRLADAVLISNLFGRATSSLVVAQELHEAYTQLDHEMKRVAEIQRALLPPRLPTIPHLDVAVSYKTASRAGGDYYDFFDLEDGRWGILIADVSGHGTPAAVVMAVLRTILHTRCYQCSTPSELLSDANRHLCDNSDRYDGTFVTAFYGVYDPRDRSLCYACAGHNPPLLIDKQLHISELDQAQSIPLAVEADCVIPQQEVKLQSGDTLILYTDGITEAVNRDGEMYGRDRLLSCVCEDVPGAQHIIDCVIHKLLAFTHGGPQEDDQTLLALRVI